MSKTLKCPVAIVRVQGEHLYLFMQALQLTVEEAELLIKVLSDAVEIARRNNG